MSVGPQPVSPKTWTVSRFRSEPGFTGPADDCHALYVLTDSTLEQHCRVRAASARKIRQRIERGHRIRRPRWRVDLRTLQEVSFDPASSRLVLNCGRLAKMRLDPANTEEATAIEEIYTTLRERFARESRQVCPPTGWQRLARAVPASLAAFGSTGGALAFASAGWVALAAYETVVVTVILYRHATAAREPSIEVVTINEASPPSTHHDSGAQPAR